MVRRAPLFGWQGDPHRGGCGARHLRIVFQMQCVFHDVHAEG
nr:MAG TPA: hypothetical protein [Caudoviricetes sp.]